jgi:hypothetical protein
MNIVSFTNHAEKRSKNRSISKNEIEICINYGHRVHKTGAIFFIISKKIIKEYNLPEKLNGLCVITKDNYVITAYKNINVISNTKRLSKQNLKKYN